MINWKRYESRCGLILCCMGTCLDELRKTTEITDQNSRCGSRFSTYACRKFMFRNVMRFVAGSKCQVSFGTVTIVGRQHNTGGYEQWGESLSKGNGQGPSLGGGIINMF